MKKDPIDSAIDELAADIEKAASMLQHEDSQFHRRVMYAPYLRISKALLIGYVKTQSRLTN
ncbi:MAG: hypothetical protein AABZ84_05750 [Pseudomonadota bacterium]